MSYFTDYLTGRPPKPRAAVPAPQIADWGMLGNDVLGDCVFAGCGHAIMAFNSLVGTSDPAPDANQVKELYLLLTGNQDVGFVISKALQIWQSQGLWMNVIGAYAPVKHDSLLDLQLAIDLFGLAKLGVQLPQSAEDQFRQGVPWTYVPGSPILGGHDIEAVGYDSQFLYAVTWGKVQAIAYPWIAHYCDEAWAIISQEYVKSGHGPTLDLKSLQADLPMLKRW